MVTKHVLENRIEYRNEKGKLHRLDGPAVEWNNGSKFWYKNGLRHRENGPAVECSYGSKEWYINGKRHREDGPAVECSYGSKTWCLNGKYYYNEQQFQQEVIKIKLERLRNYGN